MKALSIIQSWASLIILGAKRYETRSWQTSHRGPLLIHSSAKIPLAAQELCYAEPFKTALAPLLLPYEPGDTRFPWDLSLGCLLGVVELVNCVKVEEVTASILTTEEERSFGNYRPGRWAWELRVLDRFTKPIALPGHLGLWDVPAGLIPPLGKESPCAASTGVS